MNQSAISTKTIFEDITYLLESTEHEFTISGDEIIVKQCPFCHGDTSLVDNQDKLGINCVKGCYHCFRCGASGTVEQLRVALKGEPSFDSKTKIAMKIWETSVSALSPEAEPLRRYFSNRGVLPEIIPDCIRYNPKLHYSDRFADEVQYWPGMVAKVEDIKGNFLGVHRTYITEDGVKAPVKDPKKSLGEITGGAIRLTSLTQDQYLVGITEGIETALSVFMATGMPMWVGVSAGGIERVELPCQLRVIYLWGDKDRSEAGQRAVAKFTEKHHQSGRAIFPLIPEGEIPVDKKSLDWLDVYSQDRDELMRSLECARVYAPLVTVTVDSSKFRSDQEGPLVLSKKALIGITGTFVDMVSPKSESDPAALTIQFLTVVGNVIGRKPAYWVGKTCHHTNLNTCIVANSSIGRKGTSLDHVLYSIERQFPGWSKRCIKSGLATGEGLIHAVRDPSEVSEPKGKKGKGRETFVDRGVEDKRLLVIESEFASVLRVAKRETNILSSTIRHAWDGKVLNSMSKKAPETATDAHISIIGHITRSELRREMNKVDVYNGFCNRFLWVFAKRSQELPFGENVDAFDLEILAASLKLAFEDIEKIQKVDIGESAREKWIEVYSSLTRYPDTALGAILSRAAPTVIRLAMIYALLDTSSLIEAKHLDAALAVWDYSQRSCYHIFGDLYDGEPSGKIMAKIKESCGKVTRTEINNLFDGHRSKMELDDVLRQLKQQGFIDCRHDRTNGRPVECWYLKEGTSSAYSAFSAQ
ncbi:MAG: toprim domain-containing protein [Oligoflexia bacterium]|nr:toprim domain-containing protein [Oligoflexia bacterium]